MKWKIGKIEIKNKLVLAPMAGISNAAYIKICEELGLGYAVTELISAEAVVRNNKKTFEMLKGLDELKIPVAVQIFGSSIDSMKKAAVILTENFNIKVIDINMGCPVPKVALRSQAGAALLKNPEKIYEMVKEVVEAVDCPVTVKIRSGWDENNINAVEVAQICEKAKAAAICIHGRTRKQSYSGKADLEIIKAVKEAVRIPVIGNGDIKDIETAKKMLDYCKVDALMIGRAALGNPWIFEKLNHYFSSGEIKEEPDYNEILDLALKHIDYLSKIKSEKVVVLEMRSHLAWYVKGLKGSASFKKDLYQKTKINDIILLIETYRKDLESGDFNA